MPRFSFRRTKNPNNPKMPKGQKPRTNTARLNPKRNFSEKIASSRIARGAAGTALLLSLSCSPKIVRIERIQNPAVTEELSARMEMARVHYKNGTTTNYFYDIGQIEDAVVLAISPQIKPEQRPNKMKALLERREKQKNSQLPTALKEMDLGWFSQAVKGRVLQVLSKKQKVALIKAKGDFSAIKESLSIKQLFEIEVAIAKAGA